MYLFNHIPKCGGTSYRVLLENVLGKDQVSQVSVNEDVDYQPDPEQFRRFDVVIGHFGVRWNESIGPHWRWMTALREPVDRVLSTYYYWRNNMPAASAELPWLQMAQNLALDDFVRSNHRLVRQGIENLQTWQLADDIRWKYHSIPERDLLDTAKANLDKFDFVGLYEDFAGSVRRLCAYLRVSSPKQIPRVNVTKDRASVWETPEDIIERIADLNRLDLELYRYAEARLAAARTAAA